MPKVPEGVVRMLAERFGRVFSTYILNQQRQQDETEDTALISGDVGALRAALAGTLERLDRIEAQLHRVQRGTVDEDDVLREWRSPPESDGLPAETVRVDLSRLDDIEALATESGVTWAQIEGVGYVEGPPSSTDNAVMLWDGTTGRKAKDSTVLVDGGDVTGVADLTITGDLAVGAASANAPLHVKGVDPTATRTMILQHPSSDRAAIAFQDNAGTDTWIIDAQDAGFSIGEDDTSAPNIHFAIAPGGAITTSGTVNGRTMSTDGTNLDTAYGWGDHATAGYMTDVVNDTTPQLGGDLDGNGNDVTDVAYLGVAAAGGAAEIRLSNTNTGVITGNTLGRVSFDAPDEASGGDALLMAAFVGAEAESSFGGTLNRTALIFATAASEVAAEKMRLSYLGYLGIGTASPVSIGHTYQNGGETNTTTGITIEQAGVGDSQLQFLLTGASRWVAGIDNSDGDSFKIGRGAGWATGVDLKIDASGNLYFGTHTAIGAETVTGYITVRDAGGTTRKLAVVS